MDNTVETKHSCVEKQWEGEVQVAEELLGGIQGCYRVADQAEGRPALGSFLHGGHGSL